MKYFDVSELHVGLRIENVWALRYIYGVVICLKDGVIIELESSLDKIKNKDGVVYDFTFTIPEEVSKGMQDIILADVSVFLEDNGSDYEEDMVDDYPEDVCDLCVEEF